MTAIFPGDIKSFTPVIDNFDVVEAANINPVYEEITSIETWLERALPIGYHSYTGAMTTDITLSDTDYPIQYLDPTTDEFTVSLPSATDTNHIYFIRNTNAAVSLSVLSGTDEVVSVDAETTTMLVSDGTTWSAISGGGGSVTYSSTITEISDTDTAGATDAVSRGDHKHKIPLVDPVFWDSTGVGLKYGTGLSISSGSLVATGGGGGGVGKNYIINPCGRVNQRTTAYTLVKNAYCWDTTITTGPDAWEGMATGTAVSAGTFTNTAAANCGVSGYALKFVNVTLTGTGVIKLRHRIEAKDAVNFKNQTASFSCKVYHDTGGAINYTVYIRKANAADNFSAVTAISDSGAQSIANTTASDLKYEDIAMGDCSNGIEIEIVVAAGAITTKNFEFTELKLEIGEAATAFEARLYAEELALCQRLAIVKKPASAYGALTDGFSGAASSTTSCDASINPPVSMRIVPSLAYTANIANYRINRNSLGVVAAAAMAINTNNSTNECIIITVTVASGLTAGENLVLQANNDTSAWIILSADL